MPDVGAREVAQIKMCIMEKIDSLQIECRM